MHIHSSGARTADAIVNECLKKAKDMVGQRLGKKGGGGSSGGSGGGSRSVSYSVIYDKYCN